MRKILLSLVALCCFYAANAQTFRFGPTVVGNLNISNETKTKLGFAVGAKAEMDFNNVEHGWFMDASVLFNLGISLEGVRHSVQSISVQFFHA